MRADPPNSMKFNHLRRASAPVRTAKRLSFGIPALDEAFGGGLSLGTVIEWGVRPGRGGRRLIVELLARATSAPWKLWCLWIGPPHGATTTLGIYPPAWSAAGVDLTRMRFAASEHPVEDLKPALVDPLFKVVVLDAPLRLTSDEAAYLAREARRLQRIVILLRDRELDDARGNVWAKIRVNCRREGWLAPGYRLEPVRGLSPRLTRFRASLDPC